MEIQLGLTITADNEEQPSNMRTGTSVIAEMSAVVRAVQLAKMSEPDPVLVFTVTDFSARHPAKAPSPTSPTFSGMVTAVSDAPTKAPSPMCNLAVNGSVSVLARSPAKIISGK